MIRLSVVHAPVGPQEGPGLDDDIQSNEEDKHQFTGPRKDDQWNPYGDGDIEDVNEPDDSPWRSLKNKRMVGVDFDGTVTAAPRYFLKLVSALRANGCRVVLITGRPYTERRVVEKACAMYGLKFDDIYCYPNQYNHDSVSLDALLASKVGTWKANLLEELKADAMIEDNDVFISRIVARLPGITILKPVGR